MENIPLEEGIVKAYFGKNIDTTPTFLARCEKGEGVILSEADIRFLGIKNFKSSKILINDCWDTPTLSATKGKIIKVILPYETGSKTLTEATRFGLGLINTDEDLVNYGINLDIHNRLEKLEGNGVYILQREELIINKDLTESQAMKHKLLLIKLGHPDYVDSKFWMFKEERNQSIEGIQKLIYDTFKLGKSEHGYDIMMGQYLPKVSNKGVLKVWRYSGRGTMARSNAETNLDDYRGRFAFITPRH